MKSDFEKYKKTILNALNEDIGTGDITTLKTIPENKNLSAKLIAKENGIISGIELAKYTLSFLDKNIIFESVFSDGDEIKKSDLIAKIKANGRALLSSERVMLNLMQRMSGIATLTHKFVKKTSDTNVTILDTRKTMPGLRVFDKLAVKHGGGENHRFGLYDMILIKENHITGAGGIVNAVELVKKNNIDNLLIEIEVKNIEELKEALTLKVDRIMLDNMNISQIKKCVKETNGRIPLEVSGNVSLENVRDIAETGVQYISVGMITHSPKALDISLVVEKIPSEKK